MSIYTKICLIFAILPEIMAPDSIIVRDGTFRPLLFPLLTLFELPSLKTNNTNDSLFLLLLPLLAFATNGLYALCLADSMRRRWVSRKFNMLVLYKCAIDSALCLLAGIVLLSMVSSGWQIPMLLRSCTIIIDALFLAGLFANIHFLVLRIYAIRWPFWFRKKFKVGHAIRLIVSSSILLFLLTSMPTLLLYLQWTRRRVRVVVMFAPFFAAFVRILLLLLHAILFGATAINVLFIYNSWRQSRAFHNAKRRRTSQLAGVQLQVQPHCQQQKTTTNLAEGHYENGHLATRQPPPIGSKLPTATIPIPLLDRTPSIINKRHQWCLVKYILSLMALCLFHWPLLFIGIDISGSSVVSKSSGLLDSNWWQSLEMAGILLRIASDAVLGIFCNIELLKSFYELAAHLLPKCCLRFSFFNNNNNSFRSSANAPKMAASLLTLAAGGPEEQSSMPRSSPSALLGDAV